MQKAGNLGIPPKSTTVPGSSFFLGGRDGFSCIHMSTHIFHPRFFSHGDATKYPPIVQRQFSPFSIHPYPFLNPPGN